MNKMNRISLSELYQEGKIEPTGAKPKLPVHFNGINSQTLRVCQFHWNICITTITMDG